MQIYTNKSLAILSSRAALVVGLTGLSQGYFADDKRVHHVTRTHGTEAALSFCMWPMCTCHAR